MASNQSPLSKNEELDIAKRYYAGETKAKLGRDFKVSPRTIGRVLDRVGGINQPMEDNDDDTDVEESVDAGTQYTGIMTPGSITVTKVAKGEHDTVTIHRGDVRFNDAWNILMEYGQERIEEAFQKVYETSSTIQQKIESFAHGNLMVDTDKEKIMFVYSEDVQIEIPDGLEKRIFSMMNEGTDGQDRLLNFADRLMANPSHRAVKELYGFLEHNDIDITDDGRFYAWKKVRSNYFDIHSNTMDNSPGKVLSVPRNMVDEDPNTTCSYGLHVCAKHYLGYFGNGSGNRILKVKVDPADVVAVPKDYNNAKMRCCGYEVLGDAKDQL